MWHFYEAKPCYAKHLSVWGEAGTVSTGKSRKVGNRGTSMIFIGYAKNHAGDCYRTYITNRRYVTETRDIRGCIVCTTASQKLEIKS